MYRAMLVAVMLVAGWSATGISYGAGKPFTRERVVNQHFDLKRGICVVLGDKQCQIALNLARQTELTLLVQLEKAADVEAACRAADAAGFYGTRIYVEKGTPARIGLADNVADAVIWMGDPAAVVKNEVLRVLRPQGEAVVGPERWVKPVPEGVDDWSHHYHSPDNNPQSRDRLARAPYLTQFIAEPRYAPAPQVTVSSAGRVFMAFGHVAWHEREEPWLNTLVALNGYNGTMLWKRPLPSGVMVDRSTMVATPDVLYLADEQSCKLLDAATGELKGEIVPPAGTTDGTFWKWMAMEGDTLYALIGPAEPPDDVARWRSTNHGWPWEGISKGYNEREYRWGFAKTLLAIDPRTKQVRWTYQGDPPIDGRSLCMKNGRIYFANFGHYVVCLDAKSGKPLWRRTPEKDADVFEAIGPYRPGHGYVGGWKSTVYLKCTDKALYFLGPQVNWLTALSTEDGHVLWKHAAKDLHLVIRDDALYVTGPQDSREQTCKLDPLTGEVLARYQISRRACTRSTGTCDSILFRGFEGTGRFDPATGKMHWISTMRPQCHVGVVTANGLLYWAPWACDCNLQMFGAICCGPAGDFDFDQEAKGSERLERATGSVAGAEGVKIAAGDWPTYRADNARSARTTAAVPEKVKVLWQTTPRGATEPTAPAAAGEMVVVGGADGRVQALDAATGKVRWTAYTGGAIRFPPALADGRALVGSGDGWVYALDAATGRQLWRFRAAPVERKIPIYGALLSTWPVAGGVLVDKGTAYFAAGITDYDGTHVYALDAANGEIRWQNNTAGHLDEVSSRGVACQGEMLLDQGRLYLAGGNSIGPAVFDAATGRCLNDAPRSQGGTAPRGRELTLVKTNVTVTGQPFYSPPGMPVYDQSVQWRDAAVMTQNARLKCVERKTASGPSWSLVATSPTDGRELWAQPLPEGPVRWGVAVDAQGRIVVALRSGRVMCFGPAGN